MATRNEMKEFLKEHPFNENTFNLVVRKFDLENVNLLTEKVLIENKKSNLSARQRNAVLELSLIKELMTEIEKEKQISDSNQEIASFSTN